MRGEVDDDDTFKGLGLSNTSIPSELETHENYEYTNLWRSAIDIKPPSTFELYFYGNQYGVQLSGV